MTRGKHKPQQVRYVDADGKVLNARTLGEPNAEGKTELLVAFGGGKGMGIVEAVESGAKGAGTWHHLDQPS